MLSIQNPLRYLFLVFVTFCLFSLSGYSQSEFDEELDEIIEEFKGNIMKKRECRTPRNNTSDLIKDINNARKYRGKYSAEQLDSLRILQQEAKAVLDYMIEIPDCGSKFLNIDYFKLANKRIDGEVSGVVTGQSCVDIIKVKIRDYEAYVVSNNSDDNYRIDYEYEYKAREGTKTRSGSGNLSVIKNSMKQMRDNRNKELPDLSDVKIKCSKFDAY